VPTAIPSRVDEAFRVFHYVPHIALSRAAHLKAKQGKDEIILNAQGGFTLKYLNKQNERAISLVDWLKASKTAVEQTSLYWGEEWAALLATHNAIVADLVHSHS
jgi:hypothetical protein